MTKLKKSNQKRRRRRPTTTKRRRFNGHGAPTLDNFLPLDPFFETSPQANTWLHNVEIRAILGYLCQIKRKAVGRFIRYMAIFIGGFVIALIKGWLLALAMVSAIIPLAIVVGIMFTFMS